jgi:hypothetical protein
MAPLVFVFIGGVLLRCKKIEKFSIGNPLYSVFGRAIKVIVIGDGDSSEVIISNTVL